MWVLMRTEAALESAMFDPSLLPRWAGCADDAAMLHPRVAFFTVETGSAVGSRAAGYLAVSEFEHVVRALMGNDAAMLVVPPAVAVAAGWTCRSAVEGGQRPMDGGAVGRDAWRG